MGDEDASGSKAGLFTLLNDLDERPRSAVNSVVLDYYKKFGRKRDLEQYFSLSTAQSDIRDPRSLFWRRMKDQSDTSDSGEKKSESSNEICRISIKCSIPERSEMEKKESASNNNSDSPPIITDVIPAVLPPPSPSGDESIDDNNSQKSADATLDTSINKPFSPTSSITSQRKLEWDSLADIGYGNESDKKTSASSMSTLEREVLAQKQRYTLEYKQNSDLGLPTAHSTPVDPNDSNPKGKKGLGKKTISISRKDVDTVEVNVPHNVENAQPINVNLTKQFSVNLHKDGGVTIDNVKKDVSISPEKKIDAEINTEVKLDKEIQTSLLRCKEKDISSTDCLQEAISSQRIPILIGLNTLRRKQRRKKIRKSRTKLKSKHKLVKRKEVVVDKDKSGEQVSEAESFEYMPAHVYHQNQLRKQEPNRSNNNNLNVGNKSSLESSAVHTTDSSKESKYSFNKDLDKTLNVLKSTLKEKYNSNLKKKLVTEIIQRLLKSNYGEGESTPEFLSVLSLTSKKTPTTSTSEADNTEENVVQSKPKKSILRTSKFDPRNVASTSQSAPNLPSVVESDKPVTSYLSKVVSSTATESDMSNNSAKDVTSSDTAFAKTSSQELYKKYINALKREEAYKQHLQDKQVFLKQKLVRSEPVKKVPIRLDTSKNNHLKDLIKDLTRNNYDDGSGDASLLEGGSSNFDIVTQRVARKQRSHSVFTLSSGNSDLQGGTCNAKTRLKKTYVNSPRGEPINWEGRNLAGSSKRPAVTDSSVQVNINVQDKSPKLVEEANYVCLCTEKAVTSHHNPNEVKVFKCPISKQVTISTACVSNQPMCKIHSGSSSLKEDINPKLCSKHPKKEKSIIECTRCLQTKLSVHPKISDPTESDLNIIDSAECVQLINQLYRKVSKTSSECRCSNEKEYCNSYTCKSSKDNMRRHGRDEDDNLIEDVNQMVPLTDQQTVEQSAIQSCVGCHKTFTNQPESTTDNIVIPIQGTNMMLKLSIGGKASVQTERMPCPKENITDKPKPSLKGISISDECPKSVQCPKTDKETYFTPGDQVRSDFNTEKDDDIQLKYKYAFDEDSRLARSSTYPKKVQINDKKPFLRSNTDTGNLGASSAIQTETIYTKDKDTVPYFREEANQTFASQKQSKSLGDGQTQSKSVKGTPSEHTVSESSKSSSGERFHSFNTSKNKYSSEWQKLKDQKGYDSVTDEGKPKDLILDVIKDITKRYSKRETDKRSKKKCFKEIITALSYLLDTDDSGDGDQEYSKSSKGAQCSRKQSSQSDHTGNVICKDADGRSGIVPVLTTNAFPQKSNTYERRMKTEISDRGSRQSRRFSEASGVINPAFRKVDQTALKFTCDKDSGYDVKVQGSHENVSYSTEFEPVNSGQEVNILEEEAKQKSEKHKTESEGPKKQETRRNSPRDTKITCDKGCGCDGSSECRDCIEPHSLKYKTSPHTDSLKPKSAEAPFGSLKNIKTTCDKGCGCDASSKCIDCVGTSSKNYGEFLKETRTPKKEDRCTSPRKTETSDKGCGCDGSSDSSECVDSQSPRSRTGKCGKDSVKPLKQDSFPLPKRGTKSGDQSVKPTKQDICTSPRKADINYGHEFVKPKNQSRCTSPKRTENKNGNELVKPKKQDRSTSPKKTETCDRGCGCDGSCECSECVESPSTKYGTDRYPKEFKKRDRSCSPRQSRPFDLSQPKQQSRCNSPKKNQTTCDKYCSCDGISECKECSHSGRCDKEVMKTKRQDAKKFVNKCVQSTVKRVKSLYSHHGDDSSDLPVSTDPPCCTIDSPTSKLVHKIKKECEKYQKRCKSCKKCEASSTTTVSCDHCKREKSHYRHHRCRCPKNKSSDKIKKKCVAYNLIVQTSDSLISEEAVFDRYRPLQNVIVRVPKYKQANVPFKEVCAKIEQKLPYCDTRFEPKGRSQSWPNECGISSTDDVKIANACTVRDYLEKNRPDFVDRCETRQNCIRMTSESRAKERSELREQLVGLGSLPTLNDEELIYLAKQLGFRRKRPLQHKIMSEREMKKHSEKIYKSLPEVVQKKEDAKKETIKKTNLLMANIFKKNLQKKALSGDVNISNYSQVVKI